MAETPDVGISCRRIAGRERKYNMIAKSGRIGIMPHLMCHISTHTTIEGAADEPELEN
jgi:hypothetical protein